MQYWGHLIAGANHIGLHVPILDVIQIDLGEVFLAKMQGLLTWWLVSFTTFNDVEGIYI